MPPSGSGKDKILYTEAVGLVMIDYGDAVVGGFGKWERGESETRKGCIGRGGAGEGGKKESRKGTRREKS
jgi:hypothetical protein